jgi:hypothetical protein
MDGMRVCVPVHFHGTMAANATWRWQLPCGMTLVEISAVASNNSDAKISFGTTTDDDGYLTAIAIGDSGSPVIFGKGDFTGALMSDTSQCPHIAADTVVMLTVDYDGASGTAGADVTVVMTFLEG